MTDLSPIVYHRRQSPGRPRGNQYYRDRGPSRAERTICGATGTTYDVAAREQMTDWTRPVDGQSFVACPDCRRPS